jgi:hypothetical protein
MSSAIYVEQSDAYSYDIVAHEFGHYMSWAGGFLSSAPPPTSHTWQSHMINAASTSPSAAGGKLNRAQGLANAMDEGFADYFAAGVGAYWTALGSSIIGVGDPSGNGEPILHGATFSGYSSGGFPNVTVSFQHSLINLRNSTDKGAGEDTEGTIARILWGINYGGYSLAGAPGAPYQYHSTGIGAVDYGVWSLLVSAKPVSLSDLLVDVLTTDSPTPAERLGLNELLAQNGVPPIPIPVPQQQGAPAPGAGTSNAGPTVLVAGASIMMPIFTANIPQIANPPGGVSDDQLNAFAFVFLDSDYNEIDDIPGIGADGFDEAESVANSSGVYVGGGYIAPMDESVATVSWQPTAQQWQAITNAGAAYWEVVGRDSTEYFPSVDGQSTAPAGFVRTGDYASAAQPITIVEAPTVSAGSAQEGNTGTIQILLAQPAPVDETVDYQATDITAAWGTNYTFASASYPDGTPVGGGGALPERGTIVIAAGQQEVDITVQTTNQNSTDDKTFGLIAWLDGASQPELDPDGVFTINGSQSTSGGGSGGPLDTPTLNANAKWTVHYALAA